MKKITTLLTVLFALVLLSGFAQQGKGKVTGTVTDANAKAAEAVTVSLLKAKDSSLVKLSASDKNGNYSFENISAGKYLIAITAVGHQKIYSQPVDVAAEGTTAIKTLKLATQSKALNTVTVTSKKPAIEQKPGMTVLNVDASPTNTGLTALELLEKSPGVSVDNDGNISLKGKQGVLILIDGKPTYMSPTDLATMLKNMQSSNLDQIEIMTNPPAKYDAAGNSGIINIKTKKGIIRGMNGTANASYTQGKYARTNAGTNLNYRNNKLNLFGGLNGGTYMSYNKLSINRKFFAADKTLTGLGDQVSDMRFKGNYYSYKAGLDYYFSKKDVAGFVVNGWSEDHHETPYSTSNVRDANGNVDYKLVSTTNSHSQNQNVSLNANYKHTFDSAGTELSTDLDFAHFNNTSNNTLNTQGFDANDAKTGLPVQLLGHIPARVSIYSAKLDYVHPFKSGLRLEAGAKSSYVRTDNVVDYTRNNGTGWTSDDRSNHFVYNENINAAYAILSRKIKKWELSAGLRVENTIAKGHQLKNDSSFTRNYTNLFPNAGVTYSVNDKNQLSFSYSRRITRPDYDDLNPFVYFLDSLTYSQGNPYLQPQFTNNYELGHTFNRFLTTTVNYTQTDDIITQLLKQDAEKKTTYQTKDNFSSMKQLGVSISAGFPVTKWWNTNIYLNVFNNHYKGIYQNDPVNIRFTSLMTNVTNTLTLGKGWSAEVSGWYRTKGVDGLLVINSMGALNSAISKQIFNKKGTLKFGVRDMLYTQQFSGYARYSTVDVNLSGRRDTRQFNVSFTYRFGKTNIPQARRKTGGAGDEQNRVKSGGGN